MGKIKITGLSGLFGNFKVKFSSSHGEKDSSLSSVPLKSTEKALNDGLKDMDPLVRALSAEVSDNSKRRKRSRL